MTPSLVPHDLHTDESDFAYASPPPPPLSRSSAAHAALQVGGVIGATAGIGFVEACLHFERRPIPLRFAVRYALANVVPSVVWKSVPAELVAAASRTPTSALITSASSPATAPRAKQLAVLQSVRSLRQFVGSYALAWSLWRACTSSSDADATTNSTPSPAFVERVVRLGPEHSALAHASRAKHGAHITMRALSDARALAIDWRSHGLVHGHSPAAFAPQRLQLVEFEVRDDAALRTARQVIQKAMCDVPNDEQLVAVAVLPPKPLDVPALGAFDICVNPLAVVLCELARVCAAASCDAEVNSSVERPWLVHVASSTAADDDDEPASFADDVARGLLYQHSVETTQLTLDDALAAAARTDDDDEAFTSSNNIVIVTAANAADGHAAATTLLTSGAATAVVVVCDESIRASSSSSRPHSLLASLLSLAPSTSTSISSTQPPSLRVLSLADTADALLQSIRALLRSGTQPAPVQDALYRLYGPQQTLQQRRDAFSSLPTLQL